VFDPIAVALSWIGVNGAIWIALAIVFAFLWRRPLLVPLVAFAGLGADLAATGVKTLVGRPRPPIAFTSIDPLLALPHSSSFPSGHAATSFACATCFVWVSRSIRVRAFVLTLAAAIAYSRLYAGVHYPLDVLAGAALGVATALLLLLTLRVAERRAELHLLARLQQPRGDHAERRE